MTAGLWRRLAVFAALAAVLAGCLDADAPSAAPTPTRAPEPTPITTTYDLRTDVWYEGLVLHFDVVTATLDDRGGPVIVNFRIDNPTEDLGELDGKVRLVVDGTPVDATRESTVPSVPSKGSAGAVLTFELQGIASIDDAMIEVGAAPLHVAKVPLTPAAGKPLTFEPVAPELKGSGTAGSVKIALRSGLLRWDLPDWSQELDATIAALTITYDVTYTGDFGGGLAFTGNFVGSIADNEAGVALRLPDGEVVEARKDGPSSQSIELIGPRKTKKDLFSRFEIPAGATGKFALLIRNGKVVKAIQFTIED